MPATPEVGQPTRRPTPPPPYHHEPDARMTPPPMYTRAMEVEALNLAKVEIPLPSYVEATGVVEQILPRPTWEQGLRCHVEPTPSTTGWEPNGAFAIVDLENLSEWDTVSETTTTSTESTEMGPIGTSNGMSTMDSYRRARELGASRVRAAELSIRWVDVDSFYRVGCQLHKIEEILEVAAERNTGQDQDRVQALIRLAAAKLESHIGTYQMAKQTVKMWLMLKIDTMPLLSKVLTRERMKELMLMVPKTATELIMQLMPNQVMETPELNSDRRIRSERVEAPNRAFVLDLDHLTVRDRRIRNMTWEGLVLEGPLIKIAIAVVKRAQWWRPSRVADRLLFYLCSHGWDQEVVMTEEETRLNCRVCGKSEELPGYIQRQPDLDGWFGQDLTGLE